jgi:hypothetical protein
MYLMQISSTQAHEEGEEDEKELKENAPLQSASVVILTDKSVGNKATSNGAMIPRPSSTYSEPAAAPQVRELS